MGLFGNDVSTINLKRRKSMVLYHGTTMKRANQILEDNAIKIDAERHYTKDKSGGRYTTPGFLYFTNEVTFSLYFANCCNLEDKSNYTVLFQVDIPIDKISPDYDEIRIQNVPNHIRERYINDLDFSLKELKSCRLDFDIDFKLYDVKYCVLDVLNGFNPNDIVTNLGRDYEYVIENYTNLQVKFIKSLKWASVR